MKEENVYTEFNLTPEVLERYLESFRQLQAKRKRTFGRISILRLFVFILMAGGLLFALAAHFWWGWLIAGISTLGFIGLILYHMEIGNHLDCVERLIRVYEQYQKRFRGEWQTFPEDGSAFIEEGDYVSADLDVYGPGSLYQLLCTAHTPMGKRRLAEVLRQPEEDGCICSAEELRNRQEAVAELAARNSFSLNFESLAIKCESEAQYKETEWASIQTDASRGFSGLLRVLAWIYPAVFVLSIVGAFLQWWQSGVILVLFFAALFFSWCVSGYCRERVGDMFRHSRSMQAYLYMLDALASEPFEAPYLKALQETVSGTDGKNENLLLGLRQLEGLLAAYNIRYNPMAHWLLSGCCLYDIHLAGRAVKWDQRYGKCLRQGINALGELEMLSSLAVLGRTARVSYPEFVEHTTPELQIKQAVHPLLPAEAAVANDISLCGQTIIITGSNMSGKTTFLRTIGLNLILAYAGAPVCCQEMKVSLMRIFTSMRVTDDVKHGISTFYAEILRIKEMIEYGKCSRPMLCLVDEIFKGTNSADRIVGAEAVIRRLSGKEAIVIVSTHDFELCKIADNYHFEESYENDRLTFDYRLRKGICTTTNALYLLKMAGLTETE